eukprot:g16632.t1
MSIRSLTNLYRRTIVSILSGCITAWYGNCSAQGHKELQKVVSTAQTIMKANLPFMDSIYMLDAAKRRPTSVKTHHTLVLTSYYLSHQAEEHTQEHRTRSR